MLRRIVSSVAVFFVILASLGSAWGFSCSELRKARFYNAAPFSDGEDCTGDTFNAIAGEVFRDTWGFDFEYAVNSGIGGDNFFTTTEFLSYLSGISTGGVSTHGIAAWICVEYFSLDAEEKRDKSAVDQGFYVWEYIDGETIATPVFGNTKLVMLDSDGNVVLHAIGLSNEQAALKLNGSFAERSWFVNAACYGLYNEPAYSGGKPSEGKFALVGADGLINICPVMESIGSVYESLGCMEDAKYSIVLDAVDELDASLQELSFSGDTDLRGAYCIGCKDEVDGGAFTYVRMCDGRLLWSLSRSIQAEEFRVMAAARGDARFEVVGTVSGNITMGKKWFEKYEYVLPGWVDQCRVVAIVGDREIASEFASTVEPVAGPLEDYAIVWTEDEDGDNVSAKAKATGGGEYTEVIIGYQGNGDDPFDVSVLRSYYEQQGLSVRECYSEYTTYPPAAFRSYYQAVFPFNSVPPLLVLCGPVTTQSDFYPNGIETSHYDIELGTSGNCGYIRGDWNMTDVDGDGIPDGPITRLPVRSQAELDTWVANAQSYMSNSNSSISKSVGFVCGDEYNSLIYGQFADIAQQYRGAGYTSRTVLRSSDYPSSPYAWNDFTAQLNSGMSELWLFGSNTNSDLWTEALLGYDNTYLGNLTRDQGIVVWAPTCQTAYHEMQGEAGTPAYRSVMLDLFNNSTTHAVAGVGHYCGGWDIHHEIFRSYLLSERMAATIGESTVAGITYRAVRKMIEDFPYLASHAIGTFVFGCDVALQVPAPAGVRNANVQTARIFLRHNATSRPILEVWGAKDNNVKVDIYDIRGHRIRRLHAGTMGGDRLAFEWNGKDSSGVVVASGVYLYSIECTDSHIFQKVLLIR